MEMIQLQIQSDPLVETFQKRYGTTWGRFTMYQYSLLVSTTIDIRSITSQMVNPNHCLKHSKRLIFKHHPIICCRNTMRPTSSWLRLQIWKPRQKDLNSFQHSGRSKQPIRNVESATTQLPQTSRSSSPRRTQLDHQHVNREKRLDFLLEKAKGNLFVSKGFDKPFFSRAEVMANHTPLFNYTFKATFDKPSPDFRINSAVNQTSKHLSCKWLPVITISLIIIIIKTQIPSIHPPSTLSFNRSLNLEVPPTR